MNVALFTDSYPPTKSGVVTVVVQLKKMLQQLGHHVVVVTVDVAESYGEEIDETDVYRMRSIKAPVGDDQFIGLPNFNKIANFLKEHEIQIIHSHTEFSVGQAAVKVGKMLNIPVIETTHTMWEDYYRYYLKIGKVISKRVARKIIRQAYKHYYAFINVSEKARNYFKQPFMCARIPSTIIPNAIDSEKFAEKKLTAQERVEFRKELGIKEDDRVILYVGRVVEEKRVIELLEIMKRIVGKRDNVKVLFVGSGAALNDLKKNTDSTYDGKIIYAGFIEWSKLYKYYGISDMFVTVSLSEMHSMTVLEALSLNLPVVCRKDTSFTDTIYNGVNGFMADNDEEMDKYLLELVDDVEKCREMGDKGYEISQNFVLKTHTLRTLAFYEAVLKKYPKPISDQELKEAVASVEVNYKVN